jgi:hypothetical protein
VRKAYGEGQTYGRAATAKAQPFSGIVLHHTGTFARECPQHSEE